MIIKVKAFARFREAFGKEHYYMQALYLSAGLGDLDGKLRAIQIFIFHWRCFQS